MNDSNLPVKADEVITPDAVNPRCKAYVAACNCILTYGHKDVHECECGGQWTGSDETGDFQAVRLPQTIVDGPLTGMPV